jgi:hypothetical protein
LLPKGTTVLWYPKEYAYIDPSKGNKTESFSGLDTPPEVDITIIFPSYNEYERLPNILAII